jgi:uncharacterized protein
LVILPALLAGPLGKFFKAREGSLNNVDPHGDLSSRKVVGTLNEDDIDDSNLDERGRRQGVAIVHGQEAPTLRLHRPTRRTDTPHQLK